MEDFNNECHQQFVITRQDKTSTNPYTCVLQAYWAWYSAQARKDYVWNLWGDIFQIGFGLIKDKKVSAKSPLSDSKYGR